jgi:hypothetical protein
VTRIHGMPHGAEFTSNGPMRFRPSTSAHQQIFISLDGDAPQFPMAAIREGWQKFTLRAHAAWPEWSRRILQVCRQWLIPAHRTIEGKSGRYQVVSDGTGIIRWRIDPKPELTLAANLCESTAQHFPCLRESCYGVYTLLNPGTGSGCWTAGWPLKDVGTDSL